MNWIQEYQLFLFDFDGLLVDTEPLHFTSYQELCRRYGCEMDWSFEKYCREAHGKPMGIFEGLAREFPQIFEKQPDKQVLYVEKKKIYEDLLKCSSLELMEGAAALLTTLAEQNTKRA